MNVLDSIQTYICDPKKERIDSLVLNDLQIWANELGAGVHLAIMTEPYLSKVLSGEKYIESRLTKVNISPFKRASVGDVILFKRSGGAIVGIALIERVKFQELSARVGPASLAAKYADGLGYEPGYVEIKKQARFASLLWLREIRELPATPLDKRGRQAWVTFQPQSQGQSLERK